MYKLQHFVAKHRTLSKIIMIIVWAFLWLVCMAGTLEFNIVLAIICYILCVLAYFLTIDATPSAIMHKPMKAYNDNCDPYPLYTETQKLLSYKNSKDAQILILINHAAALAETGEYQAAYDTQKSINIENCYVPLNKCVYYHNLFCFCMKLKKYDEAGIWFEKYMQIYGDIKGKNAKKALESITVLTRAMETYRKGQYMECIELVNSNKPSKLVERVSGAMIYADACIALGENERAAEALGFVIQNGNRLYCVTEAAAMLRKIRGAEE